MGSLVLGERRTIEGTKYLSFCEVDVYAHGNTNPSKYYYASRNPDKDVASGPDAVFVLAYNDTDVVLTKQLRPPLGKRVIALPAGLVEPGESYIDAALRELKEETNATEAKVTLVSPMVCLSAGLSDETGVIVFVEVADTHYIKYAGNDPMEADLSAFVVKIDQIDSFIQEESRRSDTIFDSKCWFALQLVRASKAWSKSK